MAICVICVLFDNQPQIPLEPAGIGSHVFCGSGISADDADIHGLYDYKFWFIIILILRKKLKAVKIMEPGAIWEIYESSATDLLRIRKDHSLFIDLEATVSEVGLFIRSLDGRLVLARSVRVTRL